MVNGTILSLQGPKLHTLTMDVSSWSLDAICDALFPILAGDFFFPITNIYFRFIDTGLYYE